MIKAKFQLADMEDYILQQAERGRQAVIRTFQFVGETFVRNARLSGNYNDITGNLRSSIGYIILVDGKQLSVNFEESTKGTDKQTGVTQGIATAEEVGARFPKGIILVCVAGMDYALYVEAKGLEVISASSLEASDQLKELLAGL